VEGRFCRTAVPLRLTRIIARVSFPFARTSSEPFVRARAERVISAVRVVIAASTLFAVWLDPTEPQRSAVLVYTMHVAFLVYAMCLTALCWTREFGPQFSLVTHLCDIGIASALQYLTLGPSSPFFTYFQYVLFSAALRWGWQATVRTAALLLSMYFALAFSISRSMRPGEFELDRFVIRTTYLIVSTVVLVYLGRHEARLRDEIRRLARWPFGGADDWDRAVPKTLAHAASIVGAGRVVCLWTFEEEPRTYLAEWPPHAHAIAQHSSSELEPLLPPDLADSAFVCERGPSGPSAIVITRDGKQLTWSQDSVPHLLRGRLEGPGLASAPFHIGRVSGRVFLIDLAITSAELIPLAEVVGREIGASLDRLHLQERSRQLAVAEDRIRVARNLHDGVLQSLTGIRLELQSMADVERTAEAPPAVGDRLLAIERALALEQRELRRFIEDLKPATELASVTPLAGQLDALRSRLALEWRTPITIRVSPEDLVVPDACDREVPLMVHEAVVNALKHGNPSRVSVNVYATDRELRVVVTDDGRGFPFTGRRSLDELMASNAGPASLCERVASLGGQLAVESSSAGARVELSLPLEAVHA